MIKEIKLEVGKTYAQRDEQMQYTIISYNIRQAIPFEGERVGNPKWKRLYFADGRIVKGKDGPYDLVREVKA